MRERNCPTTTSFNLQNNFFMKHLFKLGSFILCLGTFLPLTHAQPNSDNIIGFAHDNTPIHSLQFTQDGKYLMAISGSVVIWDVAKKEKVFTHTMPNMVQNACLAKDTNLFAIKHNHNEILIMEANRRTEIQTIRLNPAHEFVKIVAFGRENQVLVIQQANFHYIYELKTGLLQRKYEVNPKQPYFISGNGNILISVDTMNYQFQLFDFQSNKSLAYLKYGKGETFKSLHLDIAWDTLNQAILTHTGNKVRFWETFTYQRIPTKFIPEYELSGKERFWGLTKDCFYSLYGHDTLKMRYLNSGHVLSPVLVMGTEISSVIMSTDGKYLAAGDAFGNIKIWNYANETISALFYKTEIETEIKLLSPRHWDDTNDANDPQVIQRRRKKSGRAIKNKYLGIYSEKITTDKSPIELFLESK
jgi:WD40 repeat protein